MANVKNKFFLILALSSGLLVCASAGFASTNAAETLSGVLSETADGTFSLSSLLQAAIPLITVAGIYLIKTLLPKLPRAIFPFLTPLLGSGVEVISHLSGWSEGANPLRGALLGACGVFIHEALAQSKKILAEGNGSAEIPSQDVSSDTSLNSNR